MPHFVLKYDYFLLKHNFSLNFISKVLVRNIKLFIKYVQKQKYVFMHYITFHCVCYVIYEYTNQPSRYLLVQI